MKWLIALGLALATPAAAQVDRAILATQLEALAPTNPEAAYHLGMMRRYGIGGPKDHAQAVALFRTAVEGGQPLAAQMLGDYYGDPKNGVVESDKAEALRLKTIAAEAGYDRAQHDVARLHFEAGDNDTALEWLTRAASQGNADALRALASLYNSDAIPKDAARTYAYYTLYLKRLAAPTAKQQDFINQFQKDMSAEDKARGDKIVADWKTEPSELTKKALAGLRAAEALVTKQKGTGR